MDSIAGAKEENRTIDLTSEYFSETKDCHIYFVQEPENTSEFLTDFETLKRYHEETGNCSVKLINETCCLRFQKHELEKSFQIFVFERFNIKSPSFRHISNMKTIYIVGSKLMLSSLDGKLIIPHGSHHIFNNFMINVQICFASIPPEKKEHYKKLTEYMAGCWTHPLYSSTTHIVTEDVFSKKYIHGAKEKMKIMNPSWIDESWKVSQGNTLIENAADEDFCKKHKLKIFNNLVISSTGLTNEEKTRLQLQIEKHGGIYSSVFKTLTVKVLLLTQKDIENKKYRAAQDHNIFCLDPRWIKDSVKAGYSQNPNDYKIQKYSHPKSSTPTKENNTIALRNFNFDNTVLSDIHDQTTKNITIDETNKILRMSSRISAASSTAKSPPKFSLSNKSPTKRSNTFKIPDLPQLSLVTRKKNDSLRIPNFSPLDCSDAYSEECEIQILVNKVVCIYGYQEDLDSMNCIKECEKLGASLVDLTYSKTVDYVIAPQYILKEEPNLKYKYFVNDVWLEESVEEGRCIDPPKFYHYALYKRIENYKVLKDEVFVCSNYSERERPFIKTLIEILGGTLKETFSNNDPILICDLTEGRKYDAAVAWKKTILRANWLLQCFLHKSRVDEKSFLVGPSKVSNRNISENDYIPSSQDISLQNERVDDKNPKSPTSPSTPAGYGKQKNGGNDDFSISLLCEDLPTPARDITKQILKENRRKRNEIISPRAQKLKDLMQTPGVPGKNIVDEVSSPAPALPSCMKQLERNFGLFDNSSPYTQYVYKCKLQILDDDYVPISSSKKRNLKSDPSTPSYTDLRRDFFRRRCPELQSPLNISISSNSPRDKSPNVQHYTESQTTMSKEASKFLNFGDSTSAIPKRSGEPDEFSSLEELLKAAQENSAKKAKASERLEYEAQQESAKNSFQQPSQSENKMLLDQNTNNDEVNWSNSQIEIPQNNIRNNEITGFSYQPKTLDFKEISEIDYEDHNDPEFKGEKNANKSSLLFRNDETENVDILTDDEDNVADIAENDEEKMPIIFGISCGNVTNEIKVELQNKIKMLNIEESDTNFTHLIINKLVRSSKFFSALASGKTVLHADYLDECLKQKRLVEMDEYEVGNPQFKCTFKGGRDQLLLNGPYRCRMLVERNFDRYKNGLFTNKKFMMFASAERRANIEDVIKAGGGEIVDVSLIPSVLKRENIYACLVDDFKQLSKKNQATLKECKINVQSAKFIYDYLLTEKFLEQN